MKRILKGRGVKKFQSTLVFGRKIVQEVLERHPHLVEVIVIRRGSSLPDYVDGVSARSIVELSGELFAEIDIFNTRSPFLVVCKPEVPFWNGTLGPGCTLFLPFQDPENVGAAIRSGVAFGVSHVVIMKGAADPFHPKAIRASAGAVFDASLSTGPSMGELSS